MTYSNGTSPVVESAAKRLRQLLADEKKLVVAPGVYDGYSARIALEVGFDAIYMVNSHVPLRIMSADATSRLEQEPALPNSDSLTLAWHHSMT
jgi:2-methylisocitrate lyase-like PEP mutase family enzyme